MTSPLTAPSNTRRSSRHHARLTALLRALKDRCRLTFSELAERTAQDESGAVSASTLKRAAGGSTLPQEDVVTAYVRACGATMEDELEALKRWRAARAEQRGILAELHAPAVRSIRTPADLDAALAAAYERAGAPPRRVLQERATTSEADGTLLLPLTTLWRITRREARPATWEQCAAFLRGCGIHRRRMGPWQEAWQRIHTLRAEQPVPAAQRAARGWWNEASLSAHVMPLAEQLDLREAYRSAVDHGESATVHPVSRVYAGLDPASQRTVLTSGPTHLLTARGRARRNGTAPDTGIDAVVVCDGELVLFQSKYAGGTAAPPTGESTPAPVAPRPSGPGHRARYAASA
ncbi:helix-turn-helix domain-containing protein (plasmid) [Streptomyces murinus]|uniref:helix-turn-helix domain-containing protein n=1 Tax=Streptomyces murinus TaxID=33900 RepID=UPI0023785E6A|nr:helix-turn-helix domain-containing protein [Streptomyces murinus]WDO11282.1 helix-turn-helix domain-containing protein [Streptomyces murinus]